jgi:GcrA cell cycle regulator
MAWSDRDTQTLTLLWGQGKSATEIMKVLGGDVTRNAVIGKVHRLKLPGRMDPRAGSNPPKPKRVKKPRALPQVKAKRVTLPPLPINGPVLTSDTKLLKSAAWTVLADAPPPKTLTDLGAHECRWPIGENPTLFCGCATEKTYCPAHAKVAYRPFPVAVK